MRACRIWPCYSAQGGVLLRDASSGLSASTVPQAAPAAASERQCAAGLEIASFQGQSYLLSYGAGFGIKSQAITSSGGLGTSTTLAAAAGTTVLALTTLSLGNGSDLIFTSSLQSPGVSAWLRNSTGAVSLSQELLPTGCVGGYDVLDMRALSHWGANYLVAVSAHGDRLDVFQADANNRLRLVDQIGNDDGLWVNGPGLIETVRLGWHD
jgi:hypothetical protein